MKRIVFAIPSYRRANTCIFARELHKLGIPKSDIYVFTQNEEDRVAYRESVGSIANVVGENGVGISFNRNQALTADFGDGVRVMNVDDGVRRIYIKGFGQIKDADRLVSVCDRFFDYAERNRFDCWGVCKASSPIMARDKDIIDNPFLGTFFGVLNRRVRFNTSMKLMEDLERNCRILIGGGHLIRYDYVNVNCPHGRKGGQFDMHNTEGLELKTRSILCRVYPNIVVKDDRNRGKCNIKAGMKVVWKNARTRSGVLYGKI